MARLARAEIPEHYRPWLFDRSSLTQRVTAVCTGQFRVRVLSQTWRRPWRDEARLLGVDGEMPALVRQVQLMCDDAPWVYARTVIPRTTLVGRNRRLARLGSRPLGAALFSDPTMERGEVEVAGVRPDDALFADAVQGLADVPSRIWGRRSVFHVRGAPLLVSEIFLPGIPPAP